MFRVCLLFILLFVVWSCNNSLKHQQTSFKEDVDTIQMSHDSINFTDKHLLPDSCFKEIKVTEKWLRETEKYKNDSLPENYASYFELMLKLKKRAGNFSGKQANVYHFNMMDCKLDDDIENEKILFFKSDDTESNAWSRGISVILDKETQIWQIRGVIKTFSRSNLDLQPVVDTTQKLIRIPNHSWGTSGFNAHIFHYYKLMNKKVKPVLNLVSYQTDLPVYDSYTLDADTILFNNNEIKVTYLFNGEFREYGLKNGNPEIVREIPIIKDRMKTIVYRWNNKLERYEPVEKSRIKQPESFTNCDYDIEEFRKLYKNEINAFHKRNNTYEKMKKVMGE